MKKTWDFPGSPMVKTLPSKGAVSTGSISDWGTKFHMQRGGWDQILNNNNNNRKMVKRPEQELHKSPFSSLWKINIKKHSTWLAIR